MRVVYYNTAFIVPEVNRSDSLPKKLVEMGYPIVAIYHRESRNIGFKTTHATRTNSISGVAYDIEHGLVLRDEDTIKECLHFVIGPGGEPFADSGYHDDHVAALWLSHVGMTQYPSALLQMQSAGPQFMPGGYGQRRNSQLPEGDGYDSYD